jgi:hypothetical protein
MERALNHVREAYIATNEIGKARTVQQLVSDWRSVERLMRRSASASRRPGIVIKPIRI